MARKTLRSMVCSVAPVRAYLRWVHFSDHPGFDGPGYESPGFDGSPFKALA